MTSSMLAGERRWATRSRGMTVLGKVAVPKPLNLPSQRLENHGLDPSVEIVPKGTLSWGSRASSSASNAWGSSTLSPNADGTNSPSHLSGRPSSGSGTRPSTAGSDRTLEPTPNAWGQNSRPSSASGALTSNQSALNSLRPRSAETRPGSSHLSRFAEPSSDNSVAWGPSGVLEKLGGASSKNDGFSLSSGDFPTLGSERENSGKNTDSQDHGSYGRPGSSSGKAVSGKEKTVTSSVGEISASANVNSGAVSAWKRESPQHVEEGAQPAVEKWQGDPPPYLNANVPPQHFDTWHGPPINAPPGVWYRGPPGGPSYATPLGHGGYPVEPFPYYRHQIPHAALANSQPVPPPGAGPRGHHPKNGDLYRPHIPDAYIRPGMPMRPAFYHGPVAYEGYYGPPMGYCNSGDRDIPFMGMAAGPSVYNRHPGENAPDPINNHSRAGPHGPTVKTAASERVESGHPDDTHGPYKVLLKQHNDWNEKREEHKWEDAAPANVPYLGKEDQQRTSSLKDGQGLEDGKDEDTYLGNRILGGDTSQNFNNRETYSADSVKVKLPANKGKVKAVNDSSVNRSENAVSAFSQASPMFPSAAKDPTLIQKIEGLNAKVRASDGQLVIEHGPNRDEQKSRSQVVDVKANRFLNETGSSVVCFEKARAGGDVIPSSHEVDVAIADRTLQPLAGDSSGIASSRKTSHGVQSRLDNRGKRFNPQDGDWWRKKPAVVEPTSATAAANSESSLNICVQDHHPSVEAAEKCGIDIQGKDEGESSTPMFDPNDCQVQRAKMREMAKQRAMQLQKEEEERTREQKAKAHAKLLELDKRTQVVDGSIQKLEKAPPSGPILQEKEESKIPGEQEAVISKSETSIPPFVSTTNAQIRESSCILVGEYTVLSGDTLLETHGPILHGQSLPLQQAEHDSSAADCTAAPQVNEGSVPRHKRLGYKQKQNTALGKNLSEKSVLASSIEVHKANANVAVNDIASTDVVAGELGSSCEPSLPTNSNTVTEPSAHQRRKNNRSSKNKHKLDDVSAAVPKEINFGKVSTECVKPKTPELEPSLDKAITDKQAIQPSEQFLPSEEVSGRVNSQWKSQHSRRVARNQQGNRMSEKVHVNDALIWAPVRAQNKAEVVVEGCDKTIPETVTATSKSDAVVHNNLKSKRAEIERYVPKPAAKEMAQQGNIQFSVSQTSPDDTVSGAEPLQNIEGSQLGESAVGNMGPAVGSRNGDEKQSKQLKAHGSWCQIESNSVESALAHDAQDGSSGSNLEKNIPSEQHMPLKPDINSIMWQTKSSDDWGNPDAWSVPKNSEAAGPVMSAVVKDQALTGRGKRHPFRSHHKGMGDGRDHDHRNVNRGDVDKSSAQPSVTEIGQTDKSAASKVNRGYGERTSHWQPKSQVYSVHNQRGNRPAGGHNVTAEVSSKDSPSEDGMHFLPHHDKESREDVAQFHSYQTSSEQKNVAAAPNVGHQELKRDRRVTSFRGRPQSPSQPNVVEPPRPASMDSQNEQRTSPGFRKYGNQNSRPGKGHESRGDWSSAGQDNRMHNTSSNRERQRNNSHYEYQPIEQYSSNKSKNVEGPRDGSRYRERSQGQQRRGGNLYGRQSGSVPVDGGYD